MSTLKEYNQPNELDNTASQSCCSRSSCCAPASPVIRAMPKVGRNDPCPCSSGQKYKKCCGPQSLDNPGKTI